MMQICRASSSLPFGAADGKIDGVPMLDGGICRLHSVRKAIADGFDHNIVILTRHKGYYKEERTDATIRDSKAILSPLSDARKGTVPAGTCLQPDLRSAGSPGTERMVFVIRPTAPVL